MFDQLFSPDGLLISAYLNRSNGQSSGAQLSDLAKPLRTYGEALARPAAKAIRNDLDSLHDLAPRLDAEPAPAVAIFLSGQDGIFHYQPLRHAVWEHASIGHRPYLRPLRAMPAPLRTAVVVADRRRARLFVKEDGALTELPSPPEADLGAPTWAGFAGRDEKARRAHAAEATAHMLREVAERLFHEHQRLPLQLLVLGGHQETLDELVPHLHAYLKKLATRHFVVDSHTMTPAIVRAHTEPLEEEWRRESEEAMVAEVLGAIDAGADGARGLGEVIKAVNAKAVKQLVVAGRYQAPGVLCLNCRWIGDTEATCPVCGGATEATFDIVAEAMEAALADGGEVRQVGAGSPLDAVGIAASLRFPAL